jgi:hypothetical protein
MSTPPNIKISVPNPCSKDWEKMASQGDGKFCGHCSKVVYDFSTFTDRELVDFFSKPKEKVCGRYENTQLNRLISIQEPVATSYFHQFFMSAALALGIAGTASSQNTVATQKSGSSASVHSIKKSVTPVNDSAHQITGMVIDSANSQPLSGANLAIEHNGKRIAETTTDGEGKFKFIISRSFIGSHLTLLVMYYGADEKTIKFKLRKLPVQVAPIAMHVKSSPPNVISYKIDLISPTTTRSYTTGDSVEIHQRPVPQKKHKKWLLF